jgi:hypothetical protein
MLVADWWYFTKVKFTIGLELGGRLKEKIVLFYISLNDKKSLLKWV